MNGNDTNIGIKINEFVNSDIERSLIINKILDIYDYVEKPASIINNLKNEKMEIKTIYNDAALIPIEHMSKSLGE
jgi:hypothetical protein